MARANQSRERERERERGEQLTWFDPFCKSTLPATKNSKPGPRRNVIVPLTRNRGISLRSPSIVVTLLVTCRCSCTTSTLLYPPSPLGCGLVYNWRICKHIREPPTPRLNTTNSWLSLFAVVCSNSRFTARPPRVHVRNGAIRIIPPLLSPHWTGRNYLESGYTPLHSLFLFPFVDLARWLSELSLNVVGWDCCWCEWKRRSGAL